MRRIKAFEYLASKPLAASQELVEAALAIALRLNSQEAVEAIKSTDHDEQEGGMSVRGSTAVIPICGPIFRYADWFINLCGGTTVETVALDLATALDDPAIKSIVLNIDSGGGEATGISELAEMIRAASDRKPVIAYVGGMACSAAYWLASAAGEVVIGDTAILGSIGVVWAYPTKKDDPRSVEFVSSQSPHKRPDPKTETGKGKIQSVVDHLADVFVRSVAEYREVSPETVLADFGAGGLIVGEKAVTGGLADRIGSFEEVLAELAEDARPESSISLPARASGQAKQEQSMSLKAKFKALLGEIPDEGDDSQNATATGNQNPAEPEAAQASQPPRKPTLPASIEDSEQYKALAAQVAALQSDKREMACKSFLASHSDRIAGVSVEPLAALYASAQLVDAGLPAPKGMTALVEAFVAKAPKIGLLGNAIPNGHLPNDAKSIGSDSTTAQSNEANLDELMAMTPMGRVVLDKKTA
jgi:ClpP class serine protease